MSVVAVGEGWHNFHHAYPHDYSANEHGWTQVRCPPGERAPRQSVPRPRGGPPHALSSARGAAQWNPTTLFIDCCAHTGLVWGRTKANAAPVDASRLPRWTRAEVARRVRAVRLPCRCIHGNRALSLSRLFLTAFLTRHFALYILAKKTALLHI